MITVPESASGQPWKATDEAKRSILDQKPKPLHPNTTLAKNQLGLDQTSQINPFRLMKMANKIFKDQRWYETGLSCAQKVTMAKGSFSISGTHRGWDNTSSPFRVNMN